MSTYRQPSKITIVLEYRDGPGETVELAGNITVDITPGWRHGETWSINSDQATISTDQVHTEVEGDRL